MRNLAPGILPALGGFLLAAGVGGSSPPGDLLEACLDHVPVAVADLERTVEDYRALGFTLKPGRFHANGIRNCHVKCADGSGIELITADDAVDDLTGRYLEFLSCGDGPAFLALHVPRGGRLDAVLEDEGFGFRRQGEITELRHPGLEFLFFTRGNRWPTDRPEHFEHRNGATDLCGVWIATDEGAPLERLLTRLGGVSTRRVVLAPDSTMAAVVSLGQDEVVILPASRQLVPGRTIIGASFRVRDVRLAGGLLSAAGIGVRTGPGSTTRILVPPEETHGIWLELRGPEASH